jgi:DNA-binding transcriptional ArsR family regulator
MPVQVESRQARAIQVTPSAALELMWVLHNAEADHVLDGGRFASLEPVRIAHGQALQSFWGDDVRGFTEMVVLAQRSGTLQELEVERFFARLEKAATSDQAIPSLLSESPAERVAIARRLELLRTDAGLRARYIGLLETVWDSVKAEWDATGRQAVVTMAREWQKGLEQGVSYLELLQRRRLWPSRPELDELAEADAAEGRLVLSPGWFYGDIHVVELDGMMYAGRGIRPKGDEEDCRHAANHVSNSLKTFADPTRLAILLWLAHQPASVTEVARHFKLSQPTVSAHVQLLREAGVLEEKSEGRSSKLSANEESLRRVFGGALDELLEHFV